MTTQNFQNLTDEELVIRFQASGDNLVFGEIYNRYYKKVFHTCLGVVKDRDTAYDLVQDVMIKVMENLPTLQNGFLLGLWMHRIAKNLSIDFVKNRRAQSIVSADERFDLAAEETDMAALEAKEVLINKMGGVLEDLKVEDREIMTLKYFEDYTVEDLQKKYDISESAVKMRLARGRKRMARKLRA